MGLTTIGAVLDRINSLVASQGFTRALEPFSFDLQPSQAANKLFRVEAALDRADGNLGETQAELHRFEIWLARKVQNDPHGAQRQLFADCELIESAMTDDYPVFDYNAEKVGQEVQLPLVAEADYVVARLSAVVDFDRAL